MCLLAWRGKGLTGVQYMKVKNQRGQYGIVLSTCNCLLCMATNYMWSVQLITCKFSFCICNKSFTGKLVWSRYMHRAGNWLHSFLCVNIDLVPHIWKKLSVSNHPFLLLGPQHNYYIYCAFFLTDCWWCIWSFNNSKTLMHEALAEHGVRSWWTEIGGCLENAQKPTF